MLKIKFYYMINFNIKKIMKSDQLIQSSQSSQSTQATIKKSKYNQMKKLENKLNGELGDIWWNKYIS